MIEYSRNEMETLKKLTNKTQNIIKLIEFFTDEKYHVYVMEVQIQL